MFERLDALADEHLRDERTPGLVYAVVADGEVVHLRGVGTRGITDGDAPDADTVFRIASMTKSFTAATVLSLRDEGRLTLDDRAGEYVPALSGPAASLTIRQLLSMSGGLATDDPWGDRQQDLALDRFDAVLRDGATFAWRPGTAFEYSNLGYGVLGRVITAVAGAEYRDVVRERLLEPLGMRSTVFEAGDVERERLAIGASLRDDVFVEEPFAGYGALASMGGLFSTVNDLAVWVDGFLRAFDAETPHPLSRSSRLEMQQGVRTIPPELRWRSMREPPTAVVMSYAMGLMVRSDLRIGTTVTHSGGYPGFGSNMRWHPASGLGVITLANRTYYPAAELGDKLLREAVQAGVRPTRGVTRTPALERARDDAERLLASWDDALAARMFAMNVALDDPLEHRSAALEKLRAEHGSLRRSDEEPEVWSRVAMAWWLEGERGGRVKVEITLSPEADPKVQWFDITSVPAPSAEHLAEAERAVARVNDGATDDEAATVRTLFGRATLGPVIAGEERERTFLVTGERGDLELTVALGEDGRVGETTWKPRTVETPLFDVR